MCGVWLVWVDVSWVVFVVGIAIVFYIYKYIYWLVIGACFGCVWHDFLYDWCMPLCVCGAMSS